MHRRKREVRLEMGKANRGWDASVGGWSLVPWNPQETVSLNHTHTQV